MKKATENELMKEWVNIMVKKKTFQKLSKSHKNNMGEAESIPEVNFENLKRKISNKLLPPKHPRGQKKLIGKKMAKKNSQSILSRTFDFDPEEYLDKSLLFGLKISSENFFF